MAQLVQRLGRRRCQHARRHEQRVGRLKVVAADARVLFWPCLRVSHGPSVQQLDLVRRQAQVDLDSWVPLMVQGLVVEFGFSFFLQEGIAQGRWLG